LILIKNIGAFFIVLKFIDYKRVFYISVWFWLKI